VTSRWPGSPSLLGFPGRAYLAYASGLVLFAGGLGMMLERTARGAGGIV
jgi:hypothetical protein